MHWADPGGERRPHQTHLVVNPGSGSPSLVSLWGQDSWGLGAEKASSDSPNPLCLPSTEPGTPGSVLSKG